MRVEFSVSRCSFRRENMKAALLGYIMLDIVGRLSLGLIGIAEFGFNSGFYLFLGLTSLVISNLHFG